MAFTVITVSNGVEIKRAPLGFSWTTFFFGGIPALIRQDWVAGVLIIVANLLTWGIAGIVMSFLYNKIYAKSLFEKGYAIHVLPPGHTAQTVKTYLGYLKFPNEV
jgi:hypothetical protein